jgi:starch synthase (maltosyl-transferring)
LAFAKTDDSATSPRHLLVVANLNPHEVGEATIQVPLELFGLQESEAYLVHDLLSGASYTWRGRANYVRLQPREKIGHLFLIEKK